MSRHSYIRIVFIAGALAAGVGVAYGYAAWYWLLFLIIGYVSIVAAGSYFIRLNFFLQSANHGSRSTNSIALSFDDGPMRNFTPAVLDILKKEKVQAAFFLIGKNIAGNEDLLTRMVSEGHVVGNHSFSHSYWFSLKSRAEMESDLEQCSVEIKRVTGYTPILFRPPYGVTNPMVAGAVRAGNYQSVGWSLRSYDTTAKDASQLLEKCLKNLKNGDVILLHDWGAHTIGILSDFISAARNRGFKFVRADELLQLQPYKNE